MGIETDIATGIIVSVVAGYYFVDSGGEIFLCRGRGKLRKKGINPLVGDKVEFSFTGGEDGSVQHIFPRRNQLDRPAVANVDCVVIVLAPQDPEPNFLMIDKLLALVSARGLDPMVCINKADINPERAANWAKLYGSIGFPTVICSVETGEGLDHLVGLIGERTVVLAGQSGVGKSRITSEIAVGHLDIPIQVGEISRKGRRGKHTTRQVSLLPLGSGGKIADTPGFSVLDINLESKALHLYYPEFKKFSPGCQFSPCLHIHEPVCAVKEHLDRGVSPLRYDNYLKIFEELRQKEDKRY